MRERLLNRLKGPLLELTRYGVLLRRFDLPMLQAVFPEQFKDGNALDLFYHLQSYPYIERPDNQHYAFHDLLREIQAAEVREQQPEQWHMYHKRALDYLAQKQPSSPDWYYHAIAYDEDQGMSEWWKAIQNAYIRDLQDDFGALLLAAQDGTLKLAPGNLAKCIEWQGDFYKHRYQMNEALASYKQALALFRQVGDRLGEANCYLAQGRLALQQEDYQQALDLHTKAYQLYQQIEDRYSQARLLYYRSFVYEAMKEQQKAIEEIEKALPLARSLDLPWIDLLEERLEELKGPS